MQMLWAFKSSLVVDILGFFLPWIIFGLLFEILGNFFSNLLATLETTHKNYYKIIIKNKLIKSFFPKWISIKKQFPML
jgi:hypothetical protein